MNNISNLAFVHPNAKLGDNITIDAFAYVDKDVVIGDECHIYPHVSLRQGTILGKNNNVHDGCVISAMPQDFRWKGEESFVTIGDNNIIREHVIINRSIHAGKSTSIGNDSFILAQSHIGHDSVIGNHCVLGNAVKIAGQCRIGDCTILSSNALIHENCEVGDWCLIKGGCRVTNHVPPYVIMAHNPISYYGINAFILRKFGFDEDTIDNIAKCYRILYQGNTSVYNSLKRIINDVDDSDEKNSIISFIKNHKLSIASVKTENEL